MTVPSLDIRLLGAVRIRRDGVAVALPPSRKVLGLLAYLGLEGPTTRTRLCDLFWDGANDPRGELRWCLSKLRGLLDHPDGEPVVTTTKDQVSVDLGRAFVDVLEVERAAGLDLDALAGVAALFDGDLLEGIEPDGSADLALWLTRRRHRLRAVRLDVTRELALRSSPTAKQRWRHLESWVALAPLEPAAHEAMLDALASDGRRRDGDEHLARAIRAFEENGLDWAPLRKRWQATRGVAVSGAAMEPRSTAEAAPTRRRASIAIMPFAEGAARETGHGLTDDIITRLAKLRALFVIARGSSYALGERGLDPLEAGRVLSVDYVVSGRVRGAEKRSIAVELAETRGGRIIWTDELALRDDAVFGTVDAIVDRIVAAVAEEIEAEECRRAVLKAPTSLDAWEAYHRGLWHMYRFTQAHNREAETFFEQALALDRTFARAHAGLSFTHFQNVFLELAPDRDRQMALAYESAAESVAADDRDPAAHWALGRALWLRGEGSESVTELRRSIELSPNFALGHYTLGFVEAQSGDPRVAIDATDTSRRLSPFDPLQFGMLASRAVAHMRLGELEPAAEWALKAVARPNAHAHIVAIAASTLALTNRRDEAKRLVARIRSTFPSYDVNTLVRAFRFDREGEALLRGAARRFDFGS